MEHFIPEHVYTSDCQKLNSGTVVKITLPGDKTMHFLVLVFKACLTYFCDGLIFSFLLERPHSS